MGNAKVSRGNDYKDWDVLHRESLIKGFSGPTHLCDSIFWHSFVYPFQRTKCQKVLV